MIRLQRRGKHGELMIYGVIGEEVTAADVVEQLQEMRDLEQIDVWIASDGGSALDGITAIYNALRRHPAKIVTWIDFALSAAGVIAMAGEERHMAANGWLMLHNAFLRTAGDHHHLRRDADQVEAFTRQAIDAYRAAGVKLSVEELIELLDEETWINAERALELGFITHIEDHQAAAAALDLDHFEHVPEAARNLIAKETRMSKTSHPGGDNPSSAESILGRIRTVLAGGRQDDPPADPKSGHPAPDPPSGGANPPADPQLAALRSDITEAREELRRETAELRAERATARRERAEARVDRDLEGLGTRVSPAMLRAGLRQTLVALASAETPLTIEVTAEGSDGESETREVKAYDAHLAALRELPENPTMAAGELAADDDPSAVFGPGWSREEAAVNTRHGITPERAAELRSKYPEAYRSTGSSGQTN